jgi:hypothetical protein
MKKSDSYSDGGEWVHVIMVSSGTKLSLYLNNTLMNSTVFNPKQPSYHGFLASGNSGKSLVMLINHGRVAFKPRHILE